MERNQPKELVEVKKRLEIIDTTPAVKQVRKEIAETLHHHTLRTIELEVINGNYKVATDALDRILTNREYLKDAIAEATVMGRTISDFVAQIIGKILAYKPRRRKKGEYTMRPSQRSKSAMRKACDVERWQVKLIAGLKQLGRFKEILENDMAECLERQVQIYGAGAPDGVKSLNELKAKRLIGVLANSKDSQATLDAIKIVDEQRGWHPHRAKEEEDRGEGVTVIARIYGEEGETKTDIAIKVGGKK